MAAKKIAKKNRVSSKKDYVSGDIGGAAALLFAGVCVILLGLLQHDNLQLLMIGFGSALAFISAVLLGMAISKNK